MEQIESIWLKYSPPLLGISGRILVLKSDSIFRSKWLNFFFQWYIVVFMNKVDDQLKFSKKNLLFQ